MRRSYPPVPVGRQAVLYAQVLTSAMFEDGILHEAGGWTLMAGICSENQWFVFSDDGESTVERTFDKPREAVACLMNLVSYAGAEVACG